MDNSLSLENEFQNHFVLSDAINDVRGNGSISRNTCKGPANCWKRIGNRYAKFRFERISGAMCTTKACTPGLLRARTILKLYLESGHGLHASESSGLPALINDDCENASCCASGLSAGDSENLQRV